MSTVMETPLNPSLTTPAAPATVMTPLEDDLGPMTVTAEYFDVAIPLEALREKCPPTQIISADPLVIRELRGCYSVFFRNGAVVFWNCAATLMQVAVVRLQQVVGSVKPVDSVRDTLIVRPNQEADVVNFKDVWLKQLSLEHIKLVSESLSRSVALDRCEQNVAEALAQTSHVVQRLRADGALATSEKKTLRTIGFTMSIRETILAKLALFDDPPETWHSETLAKLFEQLNQSFDIRTRVTTLQAKVEYLADLNLIMTDLLNTRHSHRLEWIVILLIVVEVVLGVYSFFKDTGH